MQGSGEQTLRTDSTMRTTLPIADALRLLRARRGITQLAASKLEGAPDFRTLSQWETRRKVPSLPLLYRYLRVLGCDFRDLQGVLDEFEGKVAGGLERRLLAIEGRVAVLERGAEGAGEEAEPAPDKEGPDPAEVDPDEGTLGVERGEHPPHRGRE